MEDRRGVCFDFGRRSTKAPLMKGQTGSQQHRRPHRAPVYTGIPDPSLFSSVPDSETQTTLAARYMEPLPFSIREETKLSQVCREVGKIKDTTDGPRGLGGASRVTGGRDDRSLQSTKKRWVPPCTVRRDEQAPENKNDQIFRKVRGILNKLTPEKFTKLSDDLLAADLNSDVILKGVILLIFEKALDEPKYSSMYAQLCKRLTEEAPNFDPPSSPCTFRVLLLNKCKVEFENRSQANELYPNNAVLSPEDEERKQNAKRKMLGNIKFIGELGKLEILAESILHRCVQTLLVTNRYKPMAEDLECLCQIMKTCGRILDTDKGSKLMEQYFERMRQFADNQDLPSRIRFMLQDVIELRRDKWVPRKATNVEGPMPIQQLYDGENGRGGSLFGGGERKQNMNQELFRRTLKTRGGFDDVLGGPLASLHPSGPPPSSLHPHDKFNSYNGGGYHQQNYRQQNRHQQNHNHNQSSFYPQNRFNNNNNNNSNNSGVKELAPRFKKMMSHQQTATNLDEISLRPPSNSMVFKPVTAKPQVPMAPVNSNMPTPHPVKENVVVIKPAPIEKVKNNKKEKGPSKEEVLKKVGGLAEELLKEKSVEQAVSAYREARIPERLVSDTLASVLNNILDKPDADKELTMDWVAALRKDTLLSHAQMVECVRTLAGWMAEKEASVPKIYSQVAGVAALAVDRSLMLLPEVAELADGGRHYPLFLLTLQNLLLQHGKQQLSQLYNESKVNLIQTLPEADRSKERMSELLDDRGLGFLCPLLRIQDQLWRQLQADPNPSSLYKWIKENLEVAHQANPGFVSALVTVVVKHISSEAAGSDKCQEREKALLEKYKPVLDAFLTNNTDLQVIAVYALQTYCFSLDFPKGMLLRWFVNLYDLEVIEEDAFLKWREDITDAYPGKGKALFQVNSWLTWLETVSSEDEDEDET